MSKSTASAKEDIPQKLRIYVQQVAHKKVIELTGQGLGGLKML
jgi:hypothetical protein